MKTGPERNELLALLPQEIKERIFPQLREVELPLGKEISAAGQEVKSIYFPADCIISLLYLMLDGHSAEISVVGREGIVGIAVFMGGDSTSQPGDCPERRPVPPNTTRRDRSGGTAG